MNTKDKHKKPSITIWQNIDPRKINLGLFFCTEVLYRIKTTQISTQCLFYLVNLTCLIAPTDK